jgi:hypothetical protein
MNRTPEKHTTVCEEEYLEPLYYPKIKKFSAAIPSLHMNIFVHVEVTFIYKKKN